MESEIQELKTILGLDNKEDGGLFQITWKADLTVNVESGTSRHVGARSASSSVYVLLRKEEYLSWHKLHSDELHFFHRGCAIKVHLLYAAGNYECKLLGDPLRHKGATYQVHIPHDTWFAVELDDKTSYALYSEVVSPGFEFQDYISGKEEELKKQFPQHHDIITRLSRE